MAAKTQQMAAKTQFFEIANWHKAQCISKDNAPWMKLYTSLLDNDAFGNLDDEARMLIIGLWLYTARTGRYVFPADPRWIRRKIPMLNSDPDLSPLLTAIDDCGVPTPFIIYCDPPEPDESGKSSKKTTAKKAKKKQSEKRRVEESREEERKEEQRRAEESREDPAGAGVAVGKRVSARKKKTRVSAKPDNSAEKSKAGKSRAARPTAAKKQTRATSAHKPPEHPRPEPGPEPDDPTIPDALGRSDVPTGTDAAPGSVKPPAADRRNRSPSSGAVYNKDDYLFGRRVFLALGLPGDPDNGAVDETTSFASTWHKIRQGRGPPEDDRLGTRLIKEARAIARRKSARNKAAVWNNLAVKISNAH